MNIADFIIYAYSRLHNRRYISPYVFTPFRRVIRKFARLYLPDFLRNTPIKFSDKESNVIVSLTSFPDRIDSVDLVIRCFLRQTVRPQKIILWLSRNQFPNDALPPQLASLIGDIFEVCYVDGDIRSHKKYYYSLIKYPKSLVFLADDDIYYPSDTLNLILRAHKNNPHSIICRYGSIMGFIDNKLDSYNKWWWEISHATTHPDFFFGSGGGTLVKRELFFKDVLNIDLAQELTPIADDIWLNAMVNLQGTPKYKIKFGLLLQIEEQQFIRLTSENCGNNKNDQQFAKVIDYYQSKGLTPFKPSCLCNECYE